MRRRDPQDVWHELDEPNVDTKIDAWHPPLKQWLYARFKCTHEDGRVAIQWMHDRSFEDKEPEDVRPKGTTTDAKGRPLLPTLLRTRPTWDDSDVYKVLEKLMVIDICTTKNFIEAIDEELKGLPDGVNRRLTESHQKAFAMRTVRAFRHAAHELQGPQVKSDEAGQEQEQDGDDRMLEYKANMHDYVYARELPSKKKPPAKSGFRSKASERKAVEWEEAEAALVARRRALWNFQFKPPKPDKQESEPTKQAPPTKQVAVVANEPQPPSLQSQLDAAFQWKERESQPVENAEEEEDEIEPYEPDEEDLAEIKQTLQKLGGCPEKEIEQADTADQDEEDVMVRPENLETVFCRAGHPLQSMLAPHDADCDLCDAELERGYHLVWHCARCQYTLCERCHDERAQD